MRMIVVSYLMTVEIVIVIVFVASFIAITSWVQVLQFISVHKVKNLRRWLLDQTVDSIFI